MYIFYPSLWDEFKSSDHQALFWNKFNRLEDLLYQYLDEFMNQSTGTRYMSELEFL